MLCATPFRSPSGVYGCGQCMPCRINRRRLWTARLVLESSSHVYSVMATLTYRPRRHFYVRVQPRELYPVHLTWFLKALRKLYAPQRLRFFGVGEYGDQSGRPHYHVALYGVSVAEEKMIQEAWPWGSIHVGDLNAQSAAYISGYVTKKMTKSDDPRLAGRHPEFCRMSLRPGIGAKAMEDIARGLMSERASLVLAEAGDVPHEVRLDNRKYPLGRYLRKRLRKEVGWSDELPEAIKRQIAIVEGLMPDEERWARERKRAATDRVATSRAKVLSTRRKL